MRTNPKSGPPASQVPRRGTTRSRKREDAGLTALEEGSTGLPGIDPQSEVENGEVVSAGNRQDINRDEIARLAYSYWEARGGSGGSAEEDWFRAEQELMALLQAVGRR